MAAQTSRAQSNTTRAHKHKHPATFSGCLTSFAIAALVMFVLLIVAVIGLGVLANKTTPPTTRTLKPGFDDRSTSSEESLAQPKDQSQQTPQYQIVKAERRPPIKASFDIRLEEIVLAADLEHIAREIRSKERDSYERIFITYYLPDMQIGAGAWATSHWNPSLDVRILGMTAEAQQSLIQKSTLPAGEELIGRWIDNSPMVSSVIDLVLKPGTIEMRQRFKDGSTRTVPVVLNQGQYRIGRGEYLKINTRGKLEWYDREGLIVTCEKAP